MSPTCLLRKQARKANTNRWHKVSIIKNSLYLKELKNKKLVSIKMESRHRISLFTVHKSWRHLVQRLKDTHTHTLLYYVSKTKVSQSAHGPQFQFNLSNQTLSYSSKRIFFKNENLFYLCSSKCLTKVTESRIFLHRITFLLLYEYFSGHF